MSNELTHRAQEIFHHIVNEYIKNGEPVGSRTLSKLMSSSISPATIRNVMADLEEMGLLYAPHTSAGRLPTEHGLRLFVNGLLKVGGLTADEEVMLRHQADSQAKSFPALLNEVTARLSGLSQCAGLVLSPKYDRPLRHVEFIRTSKRKLLVVLVTEDEEIENRLVEINEDIPEETLVTAANYINERMIGVTLKQARNRLLSELRDQKSELDNLTSKILTSGIIESDNSAAPDISLIVKGQANLLNEVNAEQDLEGMRNLFTALETKKNFMQLVDSLLNADGVRIFIGSENPLFSFSGCSMIAAPYVDEKQKIVGAIGVIGPTRLNYAKIITMVDYTAKMISELLKNK